jgi:ribose transport system substrate-binding protein
MAISLLVTAVVSGCGLVTTHKDHVSLQGTTPIHLAVIPKSVGLDYWEKVHKGAVCAASQLGKNVSITWNGVTDETDVVGQLNLLNNYISQGINGLVYAASDATAMVGVTNSATSAGVKVINIDSGTTPQPKDAPLLATNNYAGAKLAADSLAKAIGPKGGKVAIIAFHAGTETNDQRVEGFEKELKKFRKLKIVGIQYSQNDYNTALTVTANVLTANPDLKGLFAANEASDIGAVNAVRLAHKAGKVKIIGWDTSPDEVEDVEQGLNFGIVSQDPFRMGYDGVRDATAMIRYHKRITSEDTGVALVTKHNLSNPRIRQLVFPKCGTPRQVDVAPPAPPR